LEALVLRYGVIAIFLGAGIEGEPFAIAGGVLAQRHWMHPWTAVAAAIGGAIAVDQFWFHLSRHFRDNRLVRRVMQRPAFAHSIDLIERYPVRFVSLFRFAYGLRAVAPVAIGTSRVPERLFVPLNLLAAILWGAAFTGAGYLIGPAFERAEARYGTTIAFCTVCLSAAAIAFALRRGKMLS
jgi:membrane protein DedA with SNARE-associated domain